MLNEIMLLEIADFIVSFENKYKKMIVRFRQFGADENKAPNCTVSFSDEQIIAYAKENDIFARGTAEFLLFLRGFSEFLPNNNAFLLHSACFDVDGEGVAFCALSGTGKTTQMLNWQKLLGDKMTVVNGDKPIVRFFDKDFCEKNNLDIPKGTKLGVPYAYGTPWNGKEGLGTNMRTELKHICFIERSETNFVTKPTKSEAVGRIMKQVYIPKDPVALANTLHLVDRLIDSCELWIIHCNMDPESAKVAYEEIFGM